MEEPNQKTVQKITEKLDWAIHSYNIFKKQNQPLEVVKYNFWSFITAFQQCWYYYNNLIGTIYPDLSKKAKEKKAQEIINKWKIDFLTETEQKYWDIINKLRNSDTHTEPEIPEVKEVKHRITYDYKFVVSQGKFVVIDIKHYIIEFESCDYDIVVMSDNGIAAIKKLIDFILTM